jgi:hypothetical protein
VEATVVHHHVDAMRSTSTGVGGLFLDPPMVLAARGKSALEDRNQRY